MSILKILKLDKKYKIKIGCILKIKYKKNFYDKKYLNIIGKVISIKKNKFLKIYVTMENSEFIMNLIIDCPNILDIKIKKN